jgi:hypothetical protein
MTRAFYVSLDQAQGIARSTLFGPIVRKEVIMAMLVLSIWSRSGWLPCGHAIRMAMEMNLHHALDQLSPEANTNDERDKGELEREPADDSRCCADMARSVPIRTEVRVLYLPS